MNSRHRSTHSLTVWVGDGGGTQPRAGAATHQPGPVDGAGRLGLARVAGGLLSPVLRQLLLQVFVDHPVDHGLADAPVGGGHAFPEAGHALKIEFNAYVIAKGASNFARMEKQIAFQLVGMRRSM